MAGTDVEPIGVRDEFRRLVDRMEGVAIWTSSELGTFDYVSAGFEDIWGFPAAEAEADIDRMIAGVHPEDGEQLLAAVERAATDGAEESFEHRVVRPDGSVRWVHARVFPLLDDDGNLAELVGISTDITAQKRREEELEVLNRILRHDVRNDMNVVLGWLSTVEPAVEGEVADAVERALSAGRHVVELTELSREYVDVVVGDEAFDVEAVALAPAIEGELDVQRQAFPEASFDVAGGLPDVRVRANELLRSVFRNLLVNAVQHNDSPTPSVTVSAEVEPDVVRVRVADDGPGVDDDAKERVFGKGEHGLESQGTGMGLYLSHEIVRAFDGDVWVEDNDPRGAVFCVEVPRAEPDP